MYGTEEEVGIAIKEAGVPRDELFITNKVAHGIDDIPAAAEQSLVKQSPSGSVITYVRMSKRHLGEHRTIRSSISLSITRICNAQMDMFHGCVRMVFSSVSILRMTTGLEWRYCLLRLRNGA
jgi:hypothetical protein